MLEVDENINFLMGKLHLTTQEFNLVKKELGKLLDDFKNSFKKINSNVDEGPGPHKIEDDK